LESAVGEKPERAILRVEVLVSAASQGTSVLLSGGGESILVDCGDGAATALARRPRDIAGLRLVLFTHGHPDHVGGLYSLLAALRLAGRREPLELRAPRGCREPRLLMETWKARYARSGAFPARTRALAHDSELRSGEFGIRSFRVRHRGDRGEGRRGLLPAVGYEIRWKGLRVVLSGDTGPCRELEEAVEGADLALIEATFPEPVPGLADLHLSIPEARALGRRACSYRLYHLTEGSRDLVRARERAGCHRLAVRDEI
jgi:ribonuclease BN (tRNA processing enzyme)